MQLIRPNVVQDIHGPSGRFCELWLHFVFTHCGTKRTIWTSRSKACTADGVFADPVADVTELDRRRFRPNFPPAVSVVTQLVGRSVWALRFKKSKRKTRNKETVSYNSVADLLAWLSYKIRSERWRSGSTAEWEWSRVTSGGSGAPVNTEFLCGTIAFIYLLTAPAVHPAGYSQQIFPFSSQRHRFQVRWWRLQRAVV